MRTRLLNFWERLRASYWFLPGLMAAGAVALSLVTEALDRAVTFEAVEAARWIYGGGPEGARAVLSTIAGSMITVAGVVFSITMVALALASSQFGPRLLGNFMKDTGNQVVLGTFIATFLYCLLALRSVRGLEDAEFVPHISITVGLAFGLASLGVLIYFIDHVAASIQAPNVVARVGSDLDAALDRAFPEAEEGTDSRVDAARRARSGAPDAPLAGGAEAENDGSFIAATESGYVQAIDEGGLASAAREGELTLELLVRPGDYLLQGSPLVRVVSHSDGRGDPEEGPEADDEEREKLAERVRRCFILGNQRTATQDPRFVVAQLVEVAVRALSPGINDPFTATNCIDRLGSALARVARRPLPPDAREDDEGRRRLLLRPVGFEELLCEAFDPIREHGRGETMVLLRLLDVLGGLGRCATREEDREALLWHAEKALASARQGVPEEPGRERIQRRYEWALGQIRRGEEGGDASPGGDDDG